MVQVTDVSPLTTTGQADTNRSVTGRMLSIACAPDGQTLYCGSYSNLWMSGDGGKHWQQLTWPQPAAGEFDSPGALGGWCVVDVAAALGWRPDRDPRFLARFKPRGPLGIVGFGECGVWTALGNGDGTFQPPNVVLADFGYEAGGWRVDRHPRFVVDLTGDGRADIVGFGNAGVWTALGNGDGTFQSPTFGIGNYGYDQHWRVDKHPRFLAHLTDSGFADIVGCGTDGVWTALGNGDGTFSEPNANPVLANFGIAQHWRVDRHPRFTARLTNSGFDDMVGFGTDGVFVALSNGDGTFNEPHANPVLSDLCYHQGWRVDRHPRVLADLTTSGFADIVGFGPEGVHTALGNGDGTFKEPFPNPVLENFGYAQGWRVDEHPRFLADLNGDGCADIVGFGDAGVWTALGDGDGRFADAAFVLENFGIDQGWRVGEHERDVADITRDGHADIVGFGDAGVWTAIGDGHGGFPDSRFVLPNFGAGMTVLALTQQDRAAGSHGLWRSPDGGATWTKVHTFPASGEALGQIEWALGSDHLVYVAGGSSLAISKNAGATFVDVFPWGRGGPARRVNHVALWQNQPADPAPVVIYALGDSTMFASFDGGSTWIRDLQTLPPSIGGAVSSTANGNSAKVMVISPRTPLEVIVTGDGSGAAHPAVLNRGDYTQFPFGTHTSSWDTLPLPNFLTDIAQNENAQDSGNVCLAVTQHARGDLLFYGGQRTPVVVGPVDATDPSDWHELDTGVHMDGHGVLLSPDFEAALKDGSYDGKAGTVWIINDGGIYWSPDGGAHFHHGENATTISSTNVAGASLPNSGPALTLNAGDNAGFFSMDGGTTWAYSEYNGGDNDCAFADPLRANSLLVFTPRRDVNGNDNTRNEDHRTLTVYESAPGTLPSGAVGTTSRHVVPGPQPLPSSRERWNAVNPYPMRGSRPIVRGLIDEAVPDQGDYVFILDPTASPTLVRTQNILDIQSRDEWATTATGPGQGANVFLQGPPLPKANLSVVQASGGHGATVFYVGDGTYNGGGGYYDTGGGLDIASLSGSLWSWKEGEKAWKLLVPGHGATAAVRFFVDPYRPNLVYILDVDHVKRSEDGGATWHVDDPLETQLTWGGEIPISWQESSSGLGDCVDLILTDMQFDPTNPSVRFAVGQGGACGTNDGATWSQLLHAGALPGRPTNCYYDWITDEFEPALYVAFAGRSIVKLTQLFPPIIF